MVDWDKQWQNSPTIMSVEVQPVGISIIGLSLSESGYCHVTLTNSLLVPALMVAGAQVLTCLEVTGRVTDND